MKMVYWLMSFIVAPAIAIEAPQAPESKSQETVPLVGYVVCSDQSAQYASMLLNVCQRLPAGRISCGRKVSVVQRHGDWLELAFPDGIPRYLPVSLVSRSAETFVPFDPDSGITDGGAIRCPHPPAPLEPRERAPHAIYAPNPEYTDQARKKKIRGTVELSLVVGLDGLAHDVTVRKKLGYGLDEKAIEAVRKWKFQPATKDGQPVEKNITVDMSFDIW